MTDDTHLEAVARLPTVSSPTPSPDGEAEAFVWDGTARNELYLQHPESGVNDPRCPISQARLSRDALESECGWTAGEEFEYHELDEEGHGSGDQEQKVRTFERHGSVLDEQL